MRFISQQQREFEVGFGKKIQIADCGNILLEADEQVTFVTEDGAEYDVTRKDWGFYATPSTNGRLVSFGLRAVLAKNSLGRIFVLLVEHDREESFHRYIKLENMTVLCWLDSKEAIADLVQKLK